MTNDLNNLRRYGVELEFVSNYSLSEMADKILQATGQEISVVSYSDKTDRWRLKPDCSVRGGAYAMELVTPILHGNADMELLKKVIDVCNEHGEVNRSCGMHVHIDITNEEEKPLRRLMKFFAKYETAINGVLSMSRRGNNNTYCKDSFCNNDLVAIFTTLNKKDKNGLLNSCFFSGRGKWNFQNYWRHGSVENRAHQGTLCAEKVEHWVRLTQAFVSCAFDNKGVVARHGDFTGTYGTRAMLNDLARKNCITGETKKFYIKRHKELNR